MVDRARLRTLGVLIAIVLADPLHGVGQDSNEPREFPEFRGAWTLDEGATDGLRELSSRTGRPRLYDALGFEVARTLVIATTATEVSITKDSALAEIYRFDGSESQTRDPRTNVPLLPSYRFTLVAGMLALTKKTPGDRATETITDAYRLTGWNMLNVERQLSYVGPQGHLMTLRGARNTPQVLVYRRVETKPQ